MVDTQRTSLLASLFLLAQISTPVGYAANEQAVSDGLPQATPASISEPEAPRDRKGILYFSGAETGAIQTGDAAVDGWRHELHPNYGPQSAQVVLAQARSGDRSIRMYYHADWGVWPTSGKIRSELKNPGGNQLKVGQEYWIGFSVFMEDTPNNRRVINTALQNSHAVQWHYVGDRGTSGINMRNGKWQVSFGTRRERPIKDIALGKWTDFVFHVKLSGRDDGFLKVWIDKNAAAAPDIDDRGPTARTDLNCKIGIYRGKMDTEYVEIFYDDFRIGDARSSFADVAPGE